MCHSPVWGRWGLEYRSSCFPSKHIIHWAISLGSSYATVGRSFCLYKGWLRDFWSICLCMWNKSNSSDSCTTVWTKPLQAASDTVCLGAVEMAHWWRVLLLLQRTWVLFRRPASDVTPAPRDLILSSELTHISTNKILENDLFNEGHNHAFLWGMGRLQIEFHWTR